MYRLVLNPLHLHVVKLFTSLLLLFISAPGSTGCTKICAQLLAGLYGNENPLYTKGGKNYLVQIYKKHTSSKPMGTPLPIGNHKITQIPLNLFTQSHTKYLLWAVSRQALEI